MRFQYKCENISNVCERKNYLASGIQQFHFSLYFYEKEMCTSKHINDKNNSNLIVISLLTFDM